mmetsp:Transcript_53662/g.149911  ORF Transcript_53662/g.149911 Transcript_53662/m.149911 type:complete len:500 (-) Transcript_53662:8-1507(-)
MSPPISHIAEAGDRPFNVSMLERVDRSAFVAIALHFKGHGEDLVELGRLELQARARDEVLHVGPRAAGVEGVLDRARLVGEDQAEGVGVVPVVRRAGHRALVDGGRSQVPADRRRPEGAVGRHVAPAGHGALAEVVVGHLLLCRVEAANQHTCADVVAEALGAVGVARRQRLRVLLEAPGCPQVVVRHLLVGVQRRLHNRGAGQAARLLPRLHAQRGLRAQPAAVLVRLGPPVVPEAEPRVARHAPGVRVVPAVLLAGLHAPVRLAVEGPLLLRVRGQVRGLHRQLRVLVPHGALAEAREVPVRYLGWQGVAAHPGLAERLPGGALVHRLADGVLVLRHPDEQAGLEHLVHTLALGDLRAVALSGLGLLRALQAPVDGHLPGLGPLPVPARHLRRLVWGPGRGQDRLAGPGAPGGRGAGPVDHAGRRQLQGVASGARLARREPRAAGRSGPSRRQGPRGRGHGCESADGLPARAAARVTRRRAGRGARALRLGLEPGGA